METAPCSKCPECRARRASAWSFRLRQEEKVSRSAYFITLTYDTLTVPITAKRRLSLCKRDLQLFFKKLRRSHDYHQLDAGRVIKYYAVGEYGGQTYRPHYHAIIFNADLRSMFKKSDLLKLKLTDYDGQHEVDCYQWKNGKCTVGKVTGASIGYTMKYITKPRMIPQFKGDDRLPEFSLMSKKLGVSYLTKAMRAWHLADIVNRLYCVIEDGKKISMPRYFKDKLYNNDEREQIKKHFLEKLFQEAIEDFHKEGYQERKHQKIQAIAAAFRWNNLENKKIKL